MSAQSVWAPPYRRARSQYGLVVADESAESANARTARDAAVDGRLRRLHPHVYAIAGAPRTWEQHQLAAVLAAGGEAVASHRAAARLWELLDDVDLIEITVARNRLPRLEDVVVHRSKDLRDDHVLQRRGIPVTNPMRTLCDLGAVVPGYVVSDALERALSARLVTCAAVEWMRFELGKPGRRGAGVIGRVLDARALGSRPPDGLLEPRMATLLRDRGLPRFEFQHTVTVAGRVFRLDFAQPAVLLGIEVDGYQTHGSPQALQSDLERQNLLVAVGWTILRFTWADVVRRPAWVARQIRTTLDRLGA